MTDNTTKDARRQVEQLLDHIDDDTDWKVVDYNPDIDPFQLTTVNVTLEHQPDSQTYDAQEQREQLETVKDVIETIEEGEQGADKTEVIETAWEELDIPEGIVQTRLDDLKSQGEIYEPTTDRLKTT